MTWPVRFRDCKSRHDVAVFSKRQPRADTPDRCANGLLGPSTYGCDSARARARARSRIRGQRHQHLSRYSLRGAALVFGSDGIVLACPVFDETDSAKGNLDPFFVVSTAVGVDDLVATDFIQAPWTSVNFM